MYLECTLSVPGVYRESSLSVPCVYPECASSVPRVSLECTLSVPKVYLECTFARALCRGTVRLASCRYSRVLAECSQVCAEWQQMFTHHVTNTVPRVYQYVVHPGTSRDVIHINKCDRFLPGRHAIHSHASALKQPRS